MDYEVVAVYQPLLLDLYWVTAYIVFLKELMPERIGRIEEFDVERVIIANHHNRILFMLIDQLYFGDGVFD